MSLFCCSLVFAVVVAQWICQINFCGLCDAYTISAITMSPIFVMEVSGVPALWKNWLVFYYG